MSWKITRDILESYLHCQFKAYLKSTGETGEHSEYEAMLTQARATVRDRAIDSIEADQPVRTLERAVALTIAALRRGASFIIDPIFDDECFSLRLDGVKRVNEPSKLGNFHYVPVLFHEGNNLRKQQKLLLSIYGIVLGQMQGRQPSYGVVWHGKDCRATKVRLDAHRQDAERLLTSLRQMQAGETEPPLILNDHCKICEFQRRCHLQATADNNLSLVRGIGSKEIKRYARKGIFTVAQLAHTFRPRRKGKRTAPKNHARQYALQAMAIRDKTIYVLGTVDVPKKPVTIYLDFEGGPEASNVYLIGMIVDDAGVEKRYSFWANSEDEESIICDQFLNTVAQYDDFVLFFYGSYEHAFLKRMEKQPQWKGEINRLLSRSCNVLSSIYAHVYFPTFSNGLKDIGGLLGCSWSEPDASGLKSIVWRAQWEATGDDTWKQMLIQYNLEDCAALRVVTEQIYAIAARSDSEANGDSGIGGRLPVTTLHEIDKLADTHKWGVVNFVHPDFSYVNGCAYFNYQHQRVYIRTSRTIRNNKPDSPGRRNRTLRVTRRSYVLASRCESCDSQDIIVCKSPLKRGGPRVKRAFDLVATPSGIKLSVIECRSEIHKCRTCGAVFVPKQYRRLARYFHGVKSWAMYQHVAHGISLGTIGKMIETFFDLPVARREVLIFKSMMADYYRPTCDQLLEKLLAGQLLHVDETVIRLKGSRGSGYVWAFTNLEEVVYMFRPTREGEFLRDLLKSFKGVLVSDFYAAYDSIDCPQQKCLVHLIRDMNDDLLANPFDGELQKLTKPFGTLLRSIVASIDAHGLKKWHMRKFKSDVAKYFEVIATSSPQSDVAQALRQRLLKHQPKLFTFMDFDGIPWNNNNAENAIKHFAYYRAHASGMMTAPGLIDFLTLLSICQTCRYKGISFWRFLVSRNPDVDAFAKCKRRSAGPLPIETYPDGYVTSFERMVQANLAHTSIERNN